MDKAHEASSEKSHAISQDAAPAYDAADTSHPPTYDSLSSAVHGEMSALAVGDPSETISVPMVSRMHHKSIHDMNPFSHKTGRVTQTVTVRKMTREFYLKHYVKDAEGNFVGTGRQAPDGGLVFVPGKSTPEDLMKQVQQVAFARQNIRGEGIGPYGSPQALGGAGGSMIGGAMGGSMGM
ncbi:hypothetical protein HBI56_131920 [Parastagonospora nodorum]|uniref:Uncharacterized protein n=2 Tax=Phaeosphaeria nodorum (strain SN15 / ATCC MYA-4574 / FGSC 10173) TaxID=321614 RepID=A0A7U2HZ92_PHANO|nr:hypothetical protein SNOG_05768 [Parastagonospora nodorum SN15]KAH3909758.1 hypothetical protein HBH56_151910 [Parastagonospora nodorum]EAT86832.1 hypothetical protein SNOG_05768 [Parastagonospora nodorum SN15]KAH3926832.1 hypothetical protein HBH54_165790 [Parastagonospora nodorum]KAH3940415.1 hypothetical protein HBH53_218730 [Parastagonospora nodorum]KAH3970474.1 hypothetical protein HBH52_165090 [Parastagonospora nodorum]